jgi:superoxide dismutase, Cu-Zn family
VRNMGSLVFVVALAGVTSAAMTRQGERAHAELHDASGKSVGTATFEQIARGVLIDLTLTGAPEGVHALHIHTVGKCEAPLFTTAGGHWNPGGKLHGLMTAGGGHAGDLPNVYVPAGGSLHVVVLADGATLRGATGILDADGAALLLHATADDYRMDPAGNAGGRIACGVITAN